MTTSKGMMSAWRLFWFEQTPRRDLALFRIVVVSMNVVYLLGAGVLGFVESASRLSGALYAPLPIVSLPLSLLGLFERPSFAVLAGTFWIVIASGVLAALGCMSRISSSVFAVGYLSLYGYVYSFGEFHHPPGLALIILLVLPFSPAGSALSIDALLVSRAHRPAIPPGRRRSRLVRWPLRLAQCLLALAYISAAKSKLASGLAWANAYTLRYHLVANGLPIGLYLAEHPTLVQVGAVVTLIWEASFFIVLLFPKLAWIYAPIGLALHFGIYLAFPGHNFAPLVSLYASFIPFFLGALTPHFSTLAVRLKTLRPTAPECPPAR